jgi:glycosyltransferase involved in cell wall biosynthesis
MRIIVLNDHGSITGGADQVAIAGLNALAAQGYDVTFVTSVGPVDEQINHSSVRVVNFGFHDLLGNPLRLNAAIHGLWDFRCSQRLGEILDEFDPLDTVVHMHTWCKSLTSSVVREAQQRGFKLVCTLHDYFSVCPNGGFYDYRKQRHCPLKPMSFYCALTHCDSRSYSQKVWRFTRQIIQERIGGIPNNIEYFITISDYSESLLRPYLPERARIFRIRNPIDIAEAPPASPERNEAFSFVGRLAPEKGGTIFATAALKAEVPAIFIGKGIEEQAIRTVNSVAELRGWQNRAGVIAAIRASRALVFPSLWHETQGLAVIEAAALGVPVVVSDSCAAREAVVNGETGLLFRTGDIDDLADKLRILRNDPALAEQMGRKTHQRYWAAPSTLENHVRELVACYREILQ